MWFNAGVLGTMNWRCIWGWLSKFLMLLTLFFLALSRTKKRRWEGSRRWGIFSRANSSRKRLIVVPRVDSVMNCTHSTPIKEETINRRTESWLRRCWTTDRTPLTSNNLGRGCNKSKLHSSKKKMWCWQVAISRKKRIKRRRWDRTTSGLWPTFVNFAVFDLIQNGIRNIWQKVVCGMAAKGWKSFINLEWSKSSRLNWVLLFSNQIRKDTKSACLMSHFGE